MCMFRKRPFGVREPIHLKNKSGTVSLNFLSQERPGDKLDSVHHIADFVAEMATSYWKYV